MKLTFTEKGNWILPDESTLGNKAKNLFENTPIIEKHKLHGLFVPRSLPMPYEYLKETDYSDEFILQIIDKYFPDWKILPVRSNSPDEDLFFRDPGRNVSEYLWHKDRKYTGYCINKVLQSYDSLASKSIRKRFGIEEKAMCLLFQELISNTPTEFDADYSGSFSDLGELAFLTFTNPKEGMDAMQEPPLKEYRVNKEGNIKEDCSEEENNLAKKLKSLAKDLPELEDKGWEIEFVGNKKGTYIVQTTPISKKKIKDIDWNEEENIFNTREVVGFGYDLTTEGILYVPSINQYSAEHIPLLQYFDNKNDDYCLTSVHSNFNRKENEMNILKHVINYSVVLDITNGAWGNEFSPHLKTLIRENGIALEGFFLDKTLRNVLRFDDIGLKTLDGDILYSPTKLLVNADEYLEKGTIALVSDKVEPFIPLRDFIKNE